MTELRVVQFGLPLRGRPILLITRMITDRIGLHLVLLPLLILLLLYRYTMIKSARHIPFYAENATKMKFHVQR